MEDEEKNGAEIHDDGGKRFERTSSSGFLIRRPQGGFEIRRKRREHTAHRTKGCRIGEYTEENRTFDKENSKNSYFCTPATQLRSPESQEKQPIISRMTGRHRSKSDHTDGIRRTVEMKREINPHPDYENITSGEEKATDVENKSWRSTQKRTGIKSRLNYTNKLKIPKVEFTVVDDEERAQEAQEEDFERSNGFEALTTEELLLIAGSSDHVDRLGHIQKGVKDAYREVVEKLMRRTGILCKKNMDPLQKKILKDLSETSADKYSPDLYTTIQEEPWKDVRYRN